MFSCIVFSPNSFTLPALSPVSSESPEDSKWRAEIQKIQGALPEIVDRGAALFSLAKRYAQLGELERSLTLLKECIALDEGFDPGTARQFQALHANPEFQAMAEELRRRYPPKHHARVAFTISEMDLVPEGLAVDPMRHVFYMGGGYRKKIIQITEDGKVSDFVQPGLYNLLGPGGIKVDFGDHGVWAADDNGHDSQLLHFDSQGKLLGRFSPPGSGPHVLNDLVLRNSCEIYVTDTFAHQVYRFDCKQHSLTPLVFHRPLFYPNGIAVSGDGSLLYVADDMGVIAVDLMSNISRDVEPGRHHTLAGIDGLYWYKGSLIGVEYGNGPHRVARWQLSPDGLTAVSEEVMEYRTPLVKFPTTGAIRDGNFYFIANTGIDNFKDGKIVDPKKLEPIHIAVVKLD